MKLKDLLYSSFDGDLSECLTKDELLNIDVYIVDSTTEFDILGSSFDGYFLIIEL